MVNDQTGLNYWMEWHFPVPAPRTFLYPVGSATLGYAVPAAIGAKIARPDRPVVAVVGDGGFLFSVNELATAVKYRLPSCSSCSTTTATAPSSTCRRRCSGRWGETDLANPDFRPWRARSGPRDASSRVDDLPRALARALAHPGPTVLELPVAIDPPWEL